MTESNNNEMKELEGKMFAVIEKHLYVLGLQKEETKIAGKVLCVRDIITLCRTHFGKMFYSQIKEVSVNRIMSNIVDVIVNEDKLKCILTGEEK